MIKTTFLSVKLDGNVFFKRAKNGSNVGVFFISDGTDKYRLSVFDDNPCYEKLKTCVEKGYLTKGKPIWVQAELSLYEDKSISQENWIKIIKSLPDELVNEIGGAENPTTIKLPHFKVIDWDFSIPKGSPHKKDNKEKISSQQKKKTPLEPLTLDEEVA